MKLAIIDIIGIPYDGMTVFRQGLGGSESAVTLMSRELAKLGFDVTVFNNCNLDHATPGNYDGVAYKPLLELQYDYEFDIVISSRTVIPFTDPADYHLLNDIRSEPFKELNIYDRIISKAKQRILWMHDTFCLGDILIEDLVVADRITDIFTLSDWHLTYVTNCWHGGKRRNFEVLKQKVFITRNGVHIYKDEVDIVRKDPSTFVYNASVTKGMIPLVESIWPLIKKSCATAKLIVIGGYYKFSSNSNPDEQEITWRNLANNPTNAALDITFTGIIPQSQIADILSEASFMIYPSAFPETFGISTLESLCYNTPVITCRFGALEEVAIDNACYLLDYAIEPNGLFPEINKDVQIQKFVNLTIDAFRNRYLLQQKQYYCNIIKEYAGWDSIALQWKQFFYKNNNRYLSKDEYCRVTKINHRVNKIWKRRYHNLVELESNRIGKEKPLVIISTFYNCRNYIERCIESVASQDYENYRHILIDDASTDDTVPILIEKIRSYPQEIQNKITVIIQPENRGAVQNQIEIIRSLPDDAIVMLLDGDDSLVNDNSILAYYNSLYTDDVEFTYGSCWSMVDNIPLIAQPYPKKVKDGGIYRQHRFNWGMPYTHFRTFKKYLINSVNDTAFKDNDGHWFKAGGDSSVFYSLIEVANPDKVHCLQDIVYNYNDMNPINDYKVNGDIQNINAQIISNQSNLSKKKILIAIPTDKNIQSETFKSIYDLEVPNGYTTTFQYFYGYQIDQIRNLIADWVVKGYDYLFSVDSDISFPSNTLTKMINHNVDVVSGLYIQRKPGLHILEIYEANENGGVSNAPYEYLKGKGLVEVAGCGFGCVLVKAEVLKQIGYPQFQYYSALDHNNTVSEDVDFCRKAREKGFKIYADADIKCAHGGQFTFNVDDAIVARNRPVTDVKTRLRQLANERSVPVDHVRYLKSIAVEYTPAVIYDIGACVLNWTKEASEIWPNARIIAFDAMDSAEFLYQERGMEYYIGVLSYYDDLDVDFYQNNLHPGGNSYYRENIEINSDAHYYFNESHIKKLKTITLDTLIEKNNLPLPDIIKMDIQGAELDALRGSSNALKYALHVILELQHVEYNKGAPHCDIVIQFMKDNGYDFIKSFYKGGVDGDYHFMRRINQ